MAVSTAQAKLQHDTDLAGGPPPTSLVGEKEFSFGDFVVDFLSFLGWVGGGCFFVVVVLGCVCVFSSSSFVVVVVVLVRFVVVFSLYLFFF